MLEIKDLKVFDEAKVDLLKTAGFTDSMIIAADADAWKNTDQNDKFWKANEELLEKAYNNAVKKAGEIETEYLDKYQQALEMVNKLVEKFPCVYVIHQTTEIHHIQKYCSLRPNKDASYREEVRYLVFEKKIPYTEITVTHIGVPNKTIEIRKHVTYSSNSWRGTEVNNGYKFFYTDRNYKNHYIKSVVTLDKNFERMDEDIRYEKEQETKKKSALEVGVEEMKAMFPDATVTTERDSDYSSYSKKYTYYDVIKVELPNGAEFVTRVSLNEKKNATDFLEYWNLKFSWRRNMTAKEKMKVIAGLNI
jgi:hypothetical protein